MISDGGENQDKSIAMFLLSCGDGEGGRNAGCVIITRSYGDEVSDFLYVFFSAIQSAALYWLT